MDIFDFLENMGIGLTIIIGIILFLFIIMFVGSLVPVLLYGIGTLFLIVAIMLLIGAIIYFIGKFTKGVIKNG